MNGNSAVSGNAGPKVRSDCEIILEITDSGGIEIDLLSRVKRLYGKSIEELVLSVLGFYDVLNARVTINDSGALPFVICARLEEALRQLTLTDLEYLPDFLPQNKYKTERYRSRVTRLYLPGNSPALMINAGLHSADGIILDLKDSVIPEKKEEARILVRNALRQVDFYGAERMVRINQGAAGIQPVDSVFSDVGDAEGLLKTVIASKSLGFEGMGCILDAQAFNPEAVK